MVVSKIDEYILDRVLILRHSIKRLQFNVNIDKNIIKISMSIDMFWNNYKNKFFLEKFK